MILLIILWISELLIISPLVKLVNASDITSHIDSSTVLTLTISGYDEPDEPDEPDVPIEKSGLKINWYDFQNADGISFLNSNIDVRREYRFRLNVSSYKGWNKIDYINIKAWFDKGSETINYNSSNNLGGNLNVFLQYKNGLNASQYNLIWPDDEVILNGFTEEIVSYSGSSTQSNNLSFSFIPGYQFRYAPGDGDWDMGSNNFNDLFSWNFKISVFLTPTGVSEPKSASVIDEFGVNSYQEIVSIGMPYIKGYPGDEALSNKNITIVTRSNTNYTLSVDLDTFIHELHPTASFSNKTLCIKGGNLNSFMNFTGFRSIFLYGSPNNPVNADNNNISKITDNIRFKCSIPLTQLSGNYRANMYIKLKSK